MKKIIFAAAALVMCTATLSAQNFDWGIKGGMNLANLTKIDDSKVKPSIFIGGFANFEVIDNLLSIQPEVLYSRQGAYFKEGGVKEWRRLNYLNIPIMCKLELIDNLTLDLGPQFGIMLNSKAKIKDGGTTIKRSIRGLKNFDVSFGMGLSYRICPLFDVSARYNLGLTKVTDIGRDKAKNSVFQIGAGFWWR